MFSPPLFFFLSTIYQHSLPFGKETWGECKELSKKSLCNTDKTCYFLCQTDEKADQEATEMLVGCAENLMSAVRQTVKETEAASVKIRAEAGQGGLQWKRQARW